MGGIGNQMFQYALSVALKNRFPEEEILFDYSYFKSVKVHNGLELERVFGVELQQASFRQLAKITYPVYSYKLSRFISKYVHKRKTELEDCPDPNLQSKIFSYGNRYYIGYWQDYRYIISKRSTLLKMFQFKLPINAQSQALLENLSVNKQQSVSLHIRRGDYLKDSGYAGLCGLDYYEKAINYMNQHVQSIVYYIFSDDIGWCRENIVPLLKREKYTFIDWNIGVDSPLDMLLMSKCKHNIIANSSFSWWAAFLNNNKNQIVCAPAKWTNHKVYTIRQLPDWILF